ncbi:MAG: tyrosine-type recombinase/integrase [Bauldia sp.]|nr:tyrosine-type recombinase/integrase [Bauldia sp.]
MPKITKRLVDSLRPSDRDQFIWDSETKGFGIRLKPSGVGTYLIQYRTAEGRTRRLKLGRIDSKAPDAARAEAKERLVEVSKGRDPSAERHELRRSITVSDLCDAYLDDAEGRIKESTRTMDRSRINSHVRPLLGTRRVAALTKRDIEKFQADVIAGKTAKPRQGRGGHITGGPGVASRTTGMLSTILQWARRKGIITVNPAADVDRPPDIKKERFLSEEEIRSLGAALAMVAPHGGPPSGLAAIRLLLLTGLRREEALSLRWDEVDLPNRCVRLGSSKSVRLRPLGSAARALLAERQKARTGEFVFPAERGEGHFMGLPKLIARLTAEAGIGDASAHTLRHTFATVAASMGYSELVIASLIGHATRGITARYAHVPDAYAIAAADAVSERVASLLLPVRPGAPRMRARKAG